MNPILRNLLIGVGAVVAGVIIFSRTSEQKAADELLGFTPETGPIGTLGSGANRILFGLPARLGSAIGEFLSGPIFDRRTVEELSALDSIKAGGRGSPEG